MAEDSTEENDVRFALNYLGRVEEFVLPPSTGLLPSITLDDFLSSVGGRFSVQQHLDLIRYQGNDGQWREIERWHVDEMYEFWQMVRKEEQTTSIPVKLFTFKVIPKSKPNPMLWKAEMRIKTGVDPYEMKKFAPALFAGWPVENYHAEARLLGGPCNPPVSSFVREESSVVFCLPSTFDSSHRFAIDPLPISRGLSLRQVLNHIEEDLDVESRPLAFRYFDFLRGIVLLDIDLVYGRHTGSGVAEDVARSIFGGEPFNFVMEVGGESARQEVMREILAPRSWGPWFEDPVWTRLMKRGFFFQNKLQQFEVAMGPTFKLSFLDIGSSYETSPGFEGFKNRLREVCGLRSTPSEIRWHGWKIEDEWTFEQWAALVRRLKPEAPVRIELVPHEDDHFSKPPSDITLGTGGQQRIDDDGKGSKHESKGDGSAKVFILEACRHQGQREFAEIVLKEEESKAASPVSDHDSSPAIHAPPIYTDTRSIQPPSYDKSSVPPVFPAHLSTPPRQEGHWTCQRVITETWTFVPGPATSKTTDITTTNLPPTTTTRRQKPLRLAPHARSLSYVVSSPVKPRAGQEEEESRSD
ncbi:uncharacterized protein JCM6883_000404 [Sporobolomyces salmoneus]|uniref:uncharacterized protein n=1 Tax=Sporobolomyces salmoneus TaxID=183962 RepID=UPI00317CB39F